MKLLLFFCSILGCMLSCIVSQSCVINKLPKNGYLRIDDYDEYDYDDTNIAKPEIGDVVDDHVDLDYYCNENYEIFGITTQTCNSGDLGPAIQECEPLCNPRKLHSVTFKPICRFAKRLVDCAKPARVGTTARIICKTGYEFVRIEEVVTCGEDGQWSAIPTPCAQICGDRYREVKHKRHAIIYREIGAKFAQICLGSILNAKLVISAMSCFWDRERWQPLNATQFKVKVGKVFRDYDSDSEELPKVQTFSVKEFFYPKTFNDSANFYADDIALLLLDQYIEFTEHIGPICIYYNSNETFHSYHNVLWYTENEIDEIHVNFLKTSIDRELCTNSTVQDTTLFTADKFCISDFQTNSRSCSSTKGYGFTGESKVEFYEYSHILLGIATVLPSNENGSCDENKRTYFTNVTHFHDFISFYDARYRILLPHADDDANFAELESVFCTIDRIPKHGSASPLGSIEKKLTLGEKIANYDTVLFECDEHFELQGNSDNLCADGKWIRPTPRCVPSTSDLGCRVLKTHRNVQISYRNNDNFVLSGEQIESYVDFGSTAEVNCQTGYELSDESTQLNVTCAKDGSWSSKKDQITCTAICGKQAPEGTAYVVGGSETKITKAPWHVGIYKDNGMIIEYQCGGTILTETAVISAMHCFWDRTKESASDPALYKVTAGKELVHYNSTSEPYSVQYFDVADLKYYPDYRDFNGNFANDIALLFLNDSIEFRSNIVPICVHKGQLSFEEVPVPDGWIGLLAGWGLTQTSGKVSEQLKIIPLPTVNKNVCAENSGSGFKDFITSDKFCAGFFDKDMGACQGDSGGGLVFVKKINGTKRFFLRGIVSVGANNAGSCDSNKYTTFTNVLYHDIFLKRYVFNGLNRV